MSGCKDDEDMAGERPEWYGKRAGEGGAAASHVALKDLVDGQGLLSFLSHLVAQSLSSSSSVRSIGFDSE